MSGNGVRGLAALLLRDDDRADAAIDDSHRRRASSGWSRTGRDGSRQTFRAAMGLPADLRQVTVTAGGEPLRLVGA